jgi:hypothetical protein
VHDRIERQTPKLTRRRIAKLVRGPRVGRLVKRQRRDENGEGDENFDEIEAGQKLERNTNGNRLRKCARNG